MKENDFLRIRFDVFPTNPSGESEATGNPTFPSNGRNLTCLAAENQLQERNAHEFASRIPSTVPGACTLICSPAFARRYAFAQQLFMRKIRMRERGTERALTGCLVRYAKGAPIPQTPHESSYRKEDSMRNRLLATTAAMLVGMTLAAAQNLPNAQSESGSAGADRQQQGRDMQRGAQDSGSAAQDKRGQSQRSEQRQQRDQTTGQSQAKDRDQNAQGQNKQEDRGNSAQSQNKESQSKQGQSKQDQSKPRSETQRNQTTGQGQHEQSRKNDRDQTQGQAPQRQQGQSDQGKQGQAQQGSPKQGGSEQSQSGQNQPQAPQGQNQAQQGRADGNVTLTSEQRTKIQQTVLAGNNVPRVNNVNFALNVGVSVPRSVRVVEVPPTLIEIYPQWRGHQYFVVHDDIVIVDGSRRIVTTLPMSSSAGNAAQVDRRGGGAQTGSAGDLVNLGPDEIRQVQIVLKERGFYRGEPDGVLGPATTQALIGFQRREGQHANGISTPARSPHSACRTGPDSRAIRTSLPRPVRAAIARSSRPRMKMRAAAGNRPPARTTATRCRRTTTRSSSSLPIRMRGQGRKTTRAEISPPPPGKAATARSSRLPDRAAAAIRAASLPTKSRNKATRTGQASNGADASN